MKKKNKTVHVNLEKKNVQLNIWLKILIKRNLYKKFQLVKNKWRNILGVSPFFIKQNDGAWLLSVSYDYDDKDKITALCVDAVSKGLPCEVKYVQFTQ